MLMKLQVSVVVAAEICLQLFLINYKYSIDNETASFDPILL